MVQRLLERRWMRPFLALFSLTLLGCHSGGVPVSDLGIPDAGIPNDMSPPPPDLLPLPPTKWSDCGPFTPSPPFDPGVYGANPICVGNLWCWEGTVPQGNLLFAVFEISPTDVWSAGVAGTILHFDGTRWSAVPSPVEVDLYGLWGSSATDVWAVGDLGYILHFNGTAWSVVTSSPAGFVLKAVWGTSATDVWAGGQRLQHWDGQSWSLVSPSVSPAAGLDWIYGIWGSGANDVYFVGASPSGPGDMAVPGASVLHWNGSSWATVGAPIGQMNFIWGTGPNDVWVSGKTVWHFDGTYWTQRATATGPIWGAAPGDVWVLGAGNYNGTSTGPSIIGSQTHITGSGVVTTSSGIDWGINAIAGAGSDAWAVGGGGEMLHFDGQSWQSHSHRLFDTSSEYSPAALLQIHGTSSTDLWAVGDGAIAHWDGNAWSQYPVCAREKWQGVFSPAPNDVWIVGGQKLLHGDGTRWRIADSPTPLHQLDGIWGSGPNDLWAVAQNNYGRPGPDGALLRSDGANWWVAFDSVNPLTAVTGTGANDVWISAGNHMGHWNGTSYEETPLSEPIVSINAAWARATDDVWAMGTNGWAHWDGVSWQVTKESLLNLYGVWGSSDTDVWAVGVPQMRHWGGSSWVSQSRATDGHGIFGTSATDVWMAGDGAILRYRAH